MHPDFGRLGKTPRHALPPRNKGYRQRRIKPRRANEGKKKSHSAKRNGFRKKSGNELLSHLTNEGSTIAAEGLNGRVRNGNGCVPLAMVTGKGCGIVSPGGGVSSTVHCKGKYDHRPLVDKGVDKTNKGQVSRLISTG